MLEVGDKFEGCLILSSEDNEFGHEWTFLWGNKAYKVEMRSDEYMSLLFDAYERQRLLDEIAIDLHSQIGERA